MKAIRNRLAATLLAAFSATFPAAAEVKITRAAGRVAVEIDGRAFTEFFIGPEAPKPYLHPLRAASGKVVTRAYPMAEVAGESTDHPHHRGLWFTHGDVNGVDFWATETPGPKKGRVRLKKINDLKSGRKSGWIDAAFDWAGPGGEALLEEQRRMTFHAHPTLRIIDLDITLRAPEKARLGDTKEGVLALRVASGLEEKVAKSPPNPPRRGRMVSSRSAEGEKQIWGKQAEWVDYSGEVEGEKLGIAILDHPANPRHPTNWHARGYGLFAANIFGQREFHHDPSRDGGLALEPGQTLRFRYRVVIHPGDSETAGIERMYKEYAGKPMS
ncbi:MAG: hypothetical protein FJW37_12360 [Acidobacteria bacterium]|nr:hypothetical protein [Acidobacteriota bacterium]